MATPTQPIVKKTACVIGGNGFVGSLLVKLLLQNRYVVHATVRDPDNLKKIPHLLALQPLGELKIFGADLTEEGSFDAAVAGCDFVFHVATPSDFASSQDLENDIIKPAIQGTLNVLKACVKAKTVKRVVWTSTGKAVSINTLNGTGLVVDEEDWSDVEFLTTHKPPTWEYAVSKTLAEKAAWKFAEENKIDLITVIPPLTIGPSLTPSIPTSIGVGTCLLTGNKEMINGILRVQMTTGSLSHTHVEDVCRAHIYLAEKESASGRYICCGVNTGFGELAKFLNKRYPQYNVPTHFGDFTTSAKVILSSEKLIKEGFSFKYGIEDIFDQTVDYLKSKGLLKN